MPLKSPDRLKTDCEVLFLVSSSGRCNLDCRYCIVEPAGRQEGSLAFEDLEFLCRHFDRKAFLMFSGKGDFFSGYAPGDRLLGRLLELDVEVGLDINATVLQELPELPDELLAKVRHVNVAFHYHELGRLGLQQRWTDNVHWILQHLSHAWILIGSVFDPALEHEWPEQLAFYRRTIFEPTGKALQPIRNLRHAYTPDQEERLDALLAEHAQLVEPAFTNDYGELFRSMVASRPDGTVACPAGQRFFRVWNDGLVQGCAHKPELDRIGGLKERILNERSAPFSCSTPNHCDCCLPALLGLTDGSSASEEARDERTAPR